MDSQIPNDASTEPMPDAELAAVSGPDTPAAAALDPDQPTDHPPEAPAAPESPAPKDPKLKGPVEVEWQLEGADLDQVEAWLLDHPPSPGLGDLGEPTVAVLADSYYDTADWRLFRAGYVLRVRAKGLKLKTTLKRNSPAVAGLRRRLEVEEALTPLNWAGMAELQGQDSGMLGPEGSAAGGSELLTEAGPVSSANRMARLLVGPRRLGVLFQLFNQRKTFPLIVDGQPQGEVVLDDVIFVGAPHRPPLRCTRVEVEVAAGLEERTLPFIDALCRDCGLVPATTSKGELGLLAAGLVPVGWPDLGRVKLEAGDLYGQAAYIVLAKHTGVFMTNEPGTRLGEDIEALHDMRVAARRLRTAFRLFADVLPAKAGKRLRGELGWAATALGAVRDRDVQLERLAEWRAQVEGVQAAALDEIGAVLTADREVARTAMLQALDSPRFDRLLRDMVNFIGTGEPAQKAGDVKKPAVRMAPSRIRSAYREVREMGDAISPDSPPERYHELRIACKRLRYALEFFRDLFGEPVAALIKPLVKLQDILGLHQDAYVAIDDLEALAARDDVALSDTAREALHEHAREYLAHAEALRADFPEAYAGIGQPVWRAVWQQLIQAGKA